MVLGTEQPPSSTPVNGIDAPVLGFRNVILILLLLGMIGLSIYTNIQNTKLSSEKEELTTRVAKLESAEGQDAAKVTDETKKQFLASKQGERILWTNVLTDFFGVVSKGDVVSVSSINATEEGRLNVALSSTENSVDPYQDAATLLKALVADKNFTEVFIPSVSSTVSQTGQELLKYSITTIYEADEESELVDAQELIESVNSEDESSEEIQAPEGAEAVVNELRQRARQIAN